MIYSMSFYSQYLSPVAKNKPMKAEYGIGICVLQLCGSKVGFSRVMGHLAVGSPVDVNRNLLVFSGVLGEFSAT